MYVISYAKLNITLKYHVITQCKECTYFQQEFISPINIMPLKHFATGLEINQFTCGKFQFGLKQTYLR